MDKIFQFLSSLHDKSENLVPEWERRGEERKRRGPEGRGERGEAEAAGRETQHVFS